MILAAIIISVSQFVAILAGCLLIRRILNAKEAEIVARVSLMAQEWFNPTAEGKPSKAAEILDAAGSVVGAAAARSIMASLSASNSHAARAANGMADELQAQQNPILGLLTGGKRGKGAALMRLAELLGPALLKGGNGGSGDNTIDVKKRIERS